MFMLNISGHIKHSDTISDTKPSGVLCHKDRPPYIFPI